MRGAIKKAVANNKGDSKMNRQLSRRSWKKSNDEYEYEYINGTKKKHNVSRLTSKEYLQKKKKYKLYSSEDTK